MRIKFGPILHPTNFNLGYNQLTMRQIPLFPLNSVLFPGMPIQLHIFEDRYRMMVRDCLQHNAPFGVVLIRQGVEALGPLAVPHPIGCTANIIEIDGQTEEQFNLTAVGDERFQIVELDRSLPYLQARVEMLPLEKSYGPALSLGVKRLGGWVDSYLALLSVMKQRKEVDLSGMELPDDPLLLLNLAASLLQIPMIEKQSLLAISHAADFVNRVQRLYRREIAVLQRLGAVTSGEAQRVALLN